MKTVTKSTAELYQVRGSGGSEGWGDITIVCGKESVSFTATSDYGTFSHVCTHCGGNPKQFMCKLDFDYAMKKITIGDLYVPNTAEYPNEIKRSIMTSRRGDCGLTKEEARAAWDDMLIACDQYNGGDLLFNELYHHELFEKVFGDTEYLPSATEPSCYAVSFWNDVWCPFIEQLKAEMLGEADNALV